MLWISLCEVVCVALLGGVFGGCLMALAQRQSNKFNMTMLEQYWKSDIEYLKALIEAQAKKILTLSVDKPVNKHVNKYRNNGYKNQRHFNQRG